MQKAKRVAAVGVDDGVVLHIIPGLHYATWRWVLEGAVELVLAEDLPDDALRDEAFWHVGLRRNF
jgi:hypothetical protein